MFTKYGYLLSYGLLWLYCAVAIYSLQRKDKFYLDKDLNYTLSRIDIKKTGPDIVIPEKVGDKQYEKYTLRIHISQELIR